MHDQEPSQAEARAELELLIPGFAEAVAAMHALDHPSLCGDPDAIEAIEDLTNAEQAAAKSGASMRPALDRAASYLARANCQQAVGSRRRLPIAPSRPYRSRSRSSHARYPGHRRTTGTRGPPNDDDGPASPPSVAAAVTARSARLRAVGVAA
jgi:hypothetical protein